MVGYLLLVLFSAVFSSFPYRAKEDMGWMTQDQTDSLYLPADLKAELWAESPMFYNPTNMDVDARGRIWVTEAVNYRNYNNDSDKVLHHQRGDRVMILEDTDGDGRADSSKIFVEDQDLRSPVGIAVMGNKIVVSCSPNMIVYTDSNYDDVPDTREILLTGFGGFDHDHSLHAVYAGPDGKWYFNVGNAGPHVVQDRGGWMLRSGSLYVGGSPYNQKNQGNMISDDGRVWVGGLALRMNDDGTGLKVMGHNFRNSYEVIPDSYGQLWQNDNDDQVVTCRTTWLMEGGNAGYFSADGTRYWNADHRPGQDMFVAHWHQDDPGVMPAGDRTGAGAPTGITVNEADLLGKHYRGLLLSADAGRNMVFGYMPMQKGSGMDLGKRVSFISSVKTDNEAYAWNDTSFVRRKEMWFRPSDVAIGTDGAIYVADWYDPVVGGHQMKDSKGYGRIYRISPRNRKLERPVYDLQTVAGQIGALRSPAINVRYQAFRLLRQGGDEAIAALKNLLRDENPYIRARAIWLLGMMGDGGLQAIQPFTASPDPRERGVAYRSMLRVSDTVSIVSRMAADSSAFVRREAAILLRDVAGSKPVVLSLMRSYPAGDRWYLEALGAVMDKDPEGYYQDARSLHSGFVDSRKWSTAMTELAWRIHAVSAVPQLMMRANAPALSRKARQQAMTAIAFIKDSAAVRAMIELSKSSLKDVATEAGYWLSFRKANDWYALYDWSKLPVNDRYERKLAEMKALGQIVINEQISMGERNWRVHMMLRDSVGGQVLLDMAAAKKIPADLQKLVGEKIFANPDPAIRVQATKYFRKPGARYDVPKILAMPASSSKGAAVYSTYCSSCHQFGTAGRSVGPELSGIRNKFDKTALLDAIINPSAAIVFGYEPWLLSLKNGSSLYGFIISENANTVVLKDIAGTSHTVAAKDLVKREKQQGSLMPDPALNKMTEQQLADVVAYLLR